MKKMETRAMVEASLLAALATLIIIISYYVPVLMTVGTVIWSIPITLLTFKYDVKTSVLALIVALILAAILTEPVSTLMLGLLYGVPSIVLGFCLRKKYSSFIIIASMSIAMIFSYIAIFKFSILLTGRDMLADFFNMVQDAVSKTTDILKSFGATQDQINTVTSQMNVSAIKMIFPGVLVSASVVAAYMNYFFVQIIFRKLRIKINELKPMDQWYVNNNISYGLFFLTISSLILAYFKVNNSDIVSSSMYVLFTFVFTIDGFALLSWFLKTRGISNKVRILLLILVFLMGFAQILFFVGIIDYIFDFRKINPMRRRNKTGE